MSEICGDCESYPCYIDVSSSDSAPSCFVSPEDIKIARELRNQITNKKISRPALGIIAAVLAEEYLKAWRLLMELPPEMKEKKQKPTCPTCGGSGKFDNEHLGGKWYGVDCLDCHGTGLAQTEGEK